jgi:hypothetical protein
MPCAGFISPNVAAVNHHHDGGVAISISMIEKPALRSP